ncbi:MAG: arabinose efflux permease, partial [Leptolyngbya sp.]
MLREFDADIDTAKAEANDLPGATSAQAPVKESSPSPAQAAPDSTAQSSSPSAPLESQPPSLEADNGFRAIFQNRNFLILWAGQLFSQLADKVYLVLMIAIIAARFDTPDQSISGWVAAVMIAFTIPAVLFGALAGVFVDGWRKRPVLVWSNLLRGGLVIVLPLGIWLTAGWGTLLDLPVAFWLLLVVTFLISTLTQFFAPAEQSIIPLIVAESDLLSANSLYTTTMMASVIVGFAVGEPLLALADKLMLALGVANNGPAILVGLSYLVAGLCLMTMDPGKENLSPPHEDWSHFLADIKDGFRYLGQQVQVRVAIIQLVLLSSVFAALAVLAVRLAEMIPTIKA